MDGTNVRSELHNALELVQSVASDELPRLIGELAELSAVAMARLTAPSPIASRPDELLNVTDAAARLSLSADYLYRHHKTLPFARRMGRRLLFSSSGIEKYIASYRCTAVRLQDTIPSVVHFNGRKANQ